MRDHITELITRRGRTRRRLSFPRHPAPGLTARHTRAAGVVAAALAAGFATPALAQAAPTIQPINDFASSVLGVLTGDLIRSAGAIAIAFGGYMMWSDRWPKSRFISLALGIVVVLGAPTIVAWLASI